MCMEAFLMKRTNIEIDEDLAAKGMALTGLHTYKELVNFALQQLVRQKSQKDLLKYFGKVNWEGNLKEMRATR